MWGMSGCELTLPKVMRCRSVCWHFCSRSFMVNPFLSPTALPPAQMTHHQYATVWLYCPGASRNSPPACGCIRILCTLGTSSETGAQDQTSLSEQEAYPLSNWQTTVPLLLLQEHCAFQTRPNINLGSSAAKRRVPAALPLVLA